MPAKGKAGARATERQGAPARHSLQPLASRGDSPDAAFVEITMSKLTRFDGIREQSSWLGILREEANKR